MKISNIISTLEKWAPPALQEGYDNSGLLVGDSNAEIERALISLDVTDGVLEEAIANNCGLIITHHPIIFGGLKKLTGRNYAERLVIKAIKNDVALYAIHTNLDNISTGVNYKIAEVLGLVNCKILQPKKETLKKLVTYVPDINLENGTPVQDVVRNAIWQAGAGHIGNYSACSFNTKGVGSYHPKEGANPFIGVVGKTEFTPEIKIEVIFPTWLEGKIIFALKNAHPYEEVAYEVYSLENENQEIGAGMIGELGEEMDAMEFLKSIKQKMKTDSVKFTEITTRKIKRVALCGGSGSFLLPYAMAVGADVFISSDFKYHQFFDAEGKIIIADIGHYETEQFTIEILYDKLKENFPNFAVLKTKVDTNPVKYI
ncbi:MAG: Nif3-like dinuclear metal center hexameric protein [Bacteroidetes bacterium]|nr:Nif3-like dinuclear metal center hexameric protein [Bacteroidota bacterium]